MFNYYKSYKKVLIIKSHKKTKLYMLEYVIPDSNYITFQLL